MSDWGTLIDQGTHWVVTTSLEISLVVVLAYGLEALFGRRWSPRWRYALWCAVLAVLWLPVRVPDPVGVGAKAWVANASRWMADSPKRDSSEQVFAAVDVPRTGQDLTATELWGTEPRFLEQRVRKQWRQEQIERISLHAAGPWKGIEIDEERSWCRLLGCVWGGGVLLALAVFSLRDLRFRRRLARSRTLWSPRLETSIAHCCRRLGVSKVPQVHEIQGLPSPATYGTWRPRILFPDNFLPQVSESDLENILLHELAHVRSADRWARWGMVFTHAAFWFHPLVWFALGRLREAQELLRDWQAMRSLPDPSPARYAETVVRILEKTSTTLSWSTATPFVGANEVKRRVQMIGRFHPRVTTGRWSGLVSLIAITVFGLGASAVSFDFPDPDRDRDGDGLSDFHELHKYGTNPGSSDSDQDGVPDGDWNERREYAYTVRSILQVLPPVTDDVLCDDYQDARVLFRSAELVELEVIHYPFNSVGETIGSNPRWREQTATMEEWTRPGPTANWDESMRQALWDALREAGIDPEELSDRELVEQATPWLLRHARTQDGFTTFCSRFVDGKVEVHPELLRNAQRGQADKNLTLEQQWERELFAKGMFEHGVRGTCTSSAIYLNGCLRALGIPTRIVLTTPLIDASDDRERSMARKLHHPQIRELIIRAASSLGNSWANHTFNEVFVAGRWRRLNYERLGQNILDPGSFGLMTHVATFSDWADGNMAETWGIRQAKRRDDVFGGSNPYSAIALSDQVGEHCDLEIAEPPVEEHLRVLTIERAFWFGSDELPSAVAMQVDEPDTAGHVVVKVNEGRVGGGIQQYQPFYSEVEKEFRWSAPGRASVPVRATRGYWANVEKGVQHFYLRIDPDDFSTMVPGIEYQLSWEGDPSDEYRWEVSSPVTLTRSESREASMRQVVELTIDSVYWSDGADSPTGPLQSIAKPVLLARVGDAKDFDQHKEFTQHADRRFFLEADGHSPLKIGCGVGGVTNHLGSFVMIQLGPGDWRDLVEGVAYTLRAQNSDPHYRWVLADEFRVSR